MKLVKQVANESNEISMQIPIFQDKLINSRFQILVEIVADL